MTPGPSGPPPSRYRVVERDRRLEVIDTRAEAAGAPAPSRSPVPRKMRFDGTREWVTRPFYDARGPRRVRLGPVGTQAIGMGAIAAVVAVLVAVVLIGVGALVVLAIVVGLAVQHGRPWLTRVLDRLAVD